jgi:4-amino-4-deoxy-L-arabinose transferase-like glycosyltransferase
MMELIRSISSQLRKIFNLGTWLRLAIGLAGALLLAIMGQIVLITKMGSTLGAVLYLLAILLFVLILGAAAKVPPATDQDRTLIKHYALPVLFLLTSMVSLVYLLAFVDSPHTAGRQNYILPIIWVFSMALFGAGVLLISRWQFPGFRSIGQSLVNNKWEIILVVGLFLLALFLRLYKLDQYPYPMLKDEAFVGREALYILQGDFTNLFHGGWQVDTVLNSLPEAFSIAVFGNTIFGVRFAPVLFGALTILFLYFLARLTFDKLTAFLAALCLLGIPPHLHFSRMGVSNIMVAFWAVLVFWSTYRAIKSGKMRDYYWAGLFTGLPLYSYTGSKLVSAIGAAMLVVCMLAQREYLRKQWRNLLVYAVILTIVSAPTLYLSYLHPETFLARFRSDNIFSNHWLISEPVNAGRSMAAALLDQFIRSTTVFVYLPAWGGFYNSPLPFLLPVAAVLFVFGFGYSLIHIKEPRHLLLQVWFWSIVILGSVIYAPSPNAERMIGGFPVAALFCGIGLVKLMEIPRRMQIVSPRVLVGITAVVMTIASLQGAFYYLSTYQKSRVFAHPYEEFEAEVCLYARTLGPDYRMYLLISPPLEITFFPAHDYLIPDIQDQQLDSITPDVLQTLPRDQGMLFFAIPAKVAELEEVARYFPGGEWREVYMQPIPDQIETVLYYSYQVPPKTTDGF